MFILKKGHQPGVNVPLRALFLVFPFQHEELSHDSIARLRLTWLCAGRVG